MKSNELMIGDLVMQDDNLQQNRVCQITGIYNNVVVDVTGEKLPLHESHIKPIQLTPEILEKNGFKDILHPRFNERKLCKVWDNYDIQINVDNKSVYMVISPLSAIRNGRADYIFPNPDYVHEFQHILKLLGITKSIQV